MAGSLFGGTLWRHRIFRLLWAGQSVSTLGSSVTILALPTLAILTLGAGPLQVGLLEAAQFLPSPFVGLFAGAAADRYSQPRIMLACDIGRLVLLLTIPAAGALHVLTMGQLYVVSLLGGTLTVFFESAYHALVPSIVSGKELVEGLGKLQASESVADVSGAGLGGLLVQLLGATQAVLIDAASFAFSGLALLRMQRRWNEPAREPAPPQSPWQEITAGVRLVAHTPILWRLGAVGATANAGYRIGQANFLVFAYGALHLSPATMGTVLALAAAGSVAGVSMSGLAARRLGPARAIAALALVAGASWLLMPVGLLGLAPLWVLLALVVDSMATPIMAVNLYALRNAATPRNSLGRVTAAMRSLTWGVMPIAAVAGGVLGTTIGPGAALAVAGAVTGAAALWLAGPTLRYHSKPQYVYLEKVAQALAERRLAPHGNHLLRRLSASMSEIPLDARGRPAPMERRSGPGSI
jgi:predicted MFS family arabinose efflux permease